MAMTTIAAFKVLGFPMVDGVFGEQPEIGSVTPENLIHKTRETLHAFATSNLKPWDEAEAEGEALAAFKVVAGHLLRNSASIDATAFDCYISRPTRVRVLPLVEQLELFGKSIAPVMDMSVYVSSFDCACGSSHILDGTVSLLREGSMKVLALCPKDPTYIVTINIKTFLGIKFKGLETTIGSRIRTIRERQQVATLIPRR